MTSQFFVDLEPFESHVFEDSLELSNHLKTLQLIWVDQGFYFSGIDSVNKISNNYQIYLHKGDKFSAVIGSKSIKKLASQLSKNLRGYANNGYPFASIKFDSAEIVGKTLNGKLSINQGPKITYDSSYFFNDLKTNSDYIYKLLDIVPGEKFSEKGYREIGDKIRRSVFLRLNRPTDLSFTNEKAKVFLDIQEQSSNTFQGVFGLQQVTSGQTSVVGNIDLKIQNLFRSGKQLHFRWERFSEESQELNLFYRHPFFLDSKISPAFTFDLLKQDTTFITRMTGLGVETFISSEGRLSLMYERTIGTLLSSDLERVSRSGLADFNRTLYTLRLSNGDESYFTTLKKEIGWNASISAGRKEIERNLNLPDSYYDSIQSNTNFYRLEGAISYQLPALKRQSFFHSIQMGTLINDELLSNELFRLGGLSSVRGFNEKSFFAKSYLMSRAEFRSYFEEESYAYLFYDQLFSSSNNSTDAPFGVGLGFALATSAGQFSFALAVGNSDNQPISFSAAKVHFGYISRF